MCAYLTALKTANPPEGSEDELTQMALNDLKTQAIVIFLNGNDDLPALSPIIRDQQLFQLDDGVMPGGHHFYPPKIVFSDANVTKAFGRVSHTQMVASREVAIDKMMQSIVNDSADLALLNEPSPTVPAPSSPANVAATSSKTPMVPPAPAWATDSPPVAIRQPWAPPDVMPAQPNWTWTTLDGNTYQNVVVTKIEPDTVSIMHSQGVAHISIDMLPLDIQKKLNYDPVAFAESQREQAHPYYTMATLAQAQDLARQLHWPLAWMCSDLVMLKTDSPQMGSEDELTQMALNDLKTQSIVIFLNGNDDLAVLSPIIRDQQLFQLDDGVMPGGHHFYPPKIVFSDANITKAFGRVSHTQMVAYREAAINNVMQSIINDPTDVALLNELPPAAPAPASATDSAPVAIQAPWAPPDVMPAQPNWTWTTSDGKSYQNVVVTKVEPDTVTISHSLGVAHIPINLLPPDIQKKLNYDPQAALQVAP
jgi:hypothetical protein